MQRFMAIFLSRTIRNALPYFFFVSIYLYTLMVLNWKVSRDVAAESCIPSSKDASILLQFKSAAIDPSHHLASWQSPPSGLNCTTSPFTAANSSSTYSICKPWLGVTCGLLHDRVTALELPGMNLSGALPTAAIVSLKFLRVLNLSSNSFHGSFPADLANCTHLQWLDLSRNTELKGSIPREWGVLGRLQQLLLVGTGLSGSIPAALANCSQLELLDLGDNQLLSGSIPAELGALSKLQHLALAITGLTGRIPASLANCSALIELSLQVSGLQGSIPAELGSLPALQIVRLFENRLTGGIPTALANCSLLSSLELGENQLSGHIPSELGRLKGILTKLGLQVNNLTGEIPATLGNCSALKQIALYENGLTGSIPSELGLLQPLILLNLFSNNLTGEVSSAMIANLTSLVVLDLSFNHLNGTLQFLNQLTNPTLFYLHVGGNRLRGQIPDIFGRFTGLQLLGLNDLPAAAPQPLPRSLQSLKSIAYLFLDASNFQGRIPSDLVPISLQLIQLFLSSNNLSGTIPGSLRFLQGLSVLDLSHNSLSGEVPSELGSLFQLQYLNLSGNNLSGPLPATLSNCALLISFNASGNQLSGPLPSLTNMTDLRALDLSFNNLTGAIPDALPFSNSSIAIQLDGNPGLCGTLVNRQCVAPAPSYTVEKNNGQDTHTSRVIKYTVIVVAGVVGMILVISLATLGFIQMKKRLRSKRAHTFDLQHPAGIHLLNASAAELKEATGGFSAGNILGTGAVGKVYRAVLSTGKAVAIKVISNEMALADEAAFRKEVAILSKLRHRNIVRVWGCCFNLELKAILLEFMPNGSLDKHLYGDGADSPQLTGLQKLRILRGVAQGLEYLHHRHPDGPIVHCDLKPPNILLDASFEACIADFGIAKMLKEAGSVESVSLLLRGSIGYIPPGSGKVENLSERLHLFGQLAGTADKGDFRALGKWRARQGEETRCLAGATGRRGLGGEEAGVDQGREEAFNTCLLYRH